MNRKKLRRANFEGFIKGAHRIYINENLTALRSQLFKKRLEIKKANNTGESGLKKAQYM